ncbi:hypothetical protein IWW34DRAFT_872700 [Fusarium oxysporum f. sp. albedinis]|nr:hypothetical protein IWW34DRAFT_872700 [Fusarium oxysporum f. sp. albedinis]KAK2471393.1 hypothetical protein H9L39_17624 [Fusarium oxysporum f. sp. albedinis]
MASQPAAGTARTSQGPGLPNSFHNLRPSPTTNTSSPELTGTGLTLAADTLRAFRQERRLIDEAYDLVASALDGIHVLPTCPELQTAVRAITAKFSSFIRQQQPTVPTRPGAGKAYAQAAGALSSTTSGTTAISKPKAPQAQQKKAPDNRLFARLPKELIAASRGYTPYALRLAVSKEIDIGPQMPTSDTQLRADIPTSSQLSSSTDY